MGRPRGSRNRKVIDREDETEVRGPHRTPELALPKPDEVIHHMKTVKGWKEKLTTIQGNLRNAIKSAKACNKHLPVVINELLALERMDDPMEYKQRLEALGIGFKAINAPFQITMHDTLLGSSTDAAYREGNDAARNGKGSNNTYPPGTEEHESYATGWRNGIGGHFGMNASETEAAIKGDEELPPADHNERNGVMEDHPA